MRRGNLSAGGLISTAQAALSASRYQQKMYIQSCKHAVIDALFRATAAPSSLSRSQLPPRACLFLSLCRTDLVLSWMLTVNPRATDRVLTQLCHPDSACDRDLVSAHFSAEPVDCFVRLLDRHASSSSFDSNRWFRPLAPSSRPRSLSLRVPLALPELLASAHLLDSCPI